MEKFIQYVLQFGNLNKQQIDLITSKATETELRKDAYFAEAVMLKSLLSVLTNGC